MAKKAKPAPKVAKKAAPQKSAPVKAAPVSAKAPDKATPLKANKASPARASKGGALDTAAAATAAAGATAPSAPKNFRNHPDIENFYRFIYENDLRDEGLEILNAVLLKKAERRAAKKAGISLTDEDDTVLDAPFAAASII